MTWRVGSLGVLVVLAGACGAPGATGAEDDRDFDEVPAAPSDPNADDEHQQDVDFTDLESTFHDDVADAGTDLDAGSPAHHDGGGAEPRCRKHITADFVVYTFLTKDIPTNGCWEVVRPVQDEDWRKCGYPNEIKTHPDGNHWAYDDTSPRHDRSTEAAGIDHCRRGATTGYEYLAYRSGAWRVLSRPNVTAYYAELYLDEQHVDHLYYQGVYARLLAALPRNKRIYPMLNIGVPTSRYSLHTVAAEVLKICRTVHDGGHLGIYAGQHYPMRPGNERLKAVAAAIDACTRASH